MVSKREHEQLDFEIAFYERVLSDKPDLAQVMVALAAAYTQKGLYKKGLDIDKRLLKMRPDDPIVRYNLACSLSLLGRVDEAFAALEESINLGYRDKGHIDKDPDLENLRRDQRYKKLISKIRRSN